MRGGGGEGVRSYECVNNLNKTPYYSPVFLAKKWWKQFRQTMIPSERVFQGEQNGANFSSIAPSSEELWVHKECDQNALL